MGEKASSEIDYEGRTLLTDEIVQQMKIYIPLLKSGFGAVSYYREQLERMCSIRGTHAVLAPLLQSFFEEILFEERRDLNDPQLVNRLGDGDVAEHVRAVFVPLIRERIVKREDRVPSASPVRLSSWKPFQATHSETRPTVSSPATLFNLVPCNRELEVAFAKFVSEAPDVAAFAKNAGPQALRIDYLAAGSRLAFYTPDFFVRSNGNCFLVEMKGREDRDVPVKARAAAAWCKAASSKTSKWTYVYVPQGSFERLHSSQFKDLVSLCHPALSELLSEDVSPQLQFLFTKAQEEAQLRLDEFVAAADFNKLPPRYQQNINQAVMLYRFIENKDTLSFTPVFTPLIGSLEDASNTLLVERLGPFVPNNKPAQKDFFSPDLTGHDKAKYYQGEIKKLERTLIFKSPISPMGHLKFAIEVGLRGEPGGGIFAALEEAFDYPNFKTLLDHLNQVYVFRNKFVAHLEKDTLLDKDAARSQLKLWINTLVLLHRTRLVEQALVSTNLRFGHALKNLAD